MGLCKWYGYEWKTKERKYDRICLKIAAVNLWSRLTGLLIVFGPAFQLFSFSRGYVRNEGNTKSRQ